MQLPTTNEYIVIGDIHSCIDELKQLLIQNGFTIDNRGLIDLSLAKKSIVLLGDFIDKGSHQKIKETIEFIYTNYYHLNRNTQQLYLILGNHEKKVYQYLTNDSTLEITPKTIEEKHKYYNTVELLERDSSLKDKFLKLYHECSVWLKYPYSDEFSVTLTHAPCEEKYLTKNDTLSHKKMVKSISRSRNFGVRLDDLMPFVHQEAKDNRHYHIFGHLSQPNIRRYKNRICIDTSAIYGGSLSCAIIKKDKLSFDSVLFQNRQKPASQTYNILFDF
ncbi:Diadenosine tetraphosphatase [hydrothermal vent metagenome]|uniref:Diadenosine tetraphosphatase n=1 Tax=hydrothermal vent metagenome TaxID=652676 RepID=A0A1W1BTW0_9ZZZZ